MEFEDIKKKAFKEINNRFDILNLFVVYKYTIIKNELIDRGFNINGPERENVFIEIITKNESRDILLLEKYLEFYDLVQENMGLVKRYDEFLKNIKNSERKEMDLNNFLSSFN